MIASEEITEDHSLINHRPPIAKMDSKQQNSGQRLEATWGF